MKKKNLTVYLVFAITFALQCFISLTVVNICATLLVSISSIITITYIFGSQKLFLRFPISSLTLLGLNLSTQSGALMYQSLTLTPLEWNLYNPINTFFYVGLYQLSLVFSHFIYSKSLFFTQFRLFITSRFQRIGLFKELSNSHSWILGLIGILAIWFSATNKVEYSDVGGKFFSSFIPFCYTPFLIPFFLKNSNAKKLTKTKNKYYLIIYFILLIFMGIFKNSRGTFAEGFITVMLIYFLLVCTNRISITYKQIKLVAIWAIPLVLSLSILSDLALSMTLVRAERKEVSASELTRKTFNVLLNREELNNYKKTLVHAIKKDYNETYIGNPFFARFITSKFDDNMIYYSTLLNDRDSFRLINITGQKILAQLPTPAINMLNLGLNKKDLAFSTGDYIWFLASGTGLGGYRVGSATAHGLIIFGGYFYLLSILFFPFIFLIIDSFAYKKNKFLIFSPIVLIFIYKFYSLCYIESLDRIIAFFVRELPQNILLFLLITLPLSLFFPTKKQGNFK